MKTLFYILLALLSLYSCTSEISTTPKPEPTFDTSTLYPSPDVVIPYHTEWTKNHYIQRIAEFKANRLQIGDIVFIGNSITELGGNWGTRFSNSKVKNRGIAGDVTVGVINRLEEIYYYKPEKVYLEIGINDLFRTELTPEYVANNIQRIVDKIHLETPSTKIYVQTILPTSNNTSLKAKIAATNAIIKNSIQTNYYQVIDLYALFADTNDLIISSYTVDGIHLTEAGYGIWENYVKGFVNN
ncbi:GDSL-type esterase/lipase family protein [Flavobacterium luteum]|nr:GDSL-type esterase/lipase family protein [Flavobacterium luteum]